MHVPPCTTLPSHGWGSLGAVHPCHLHFLRSIGNWLLADSMSSSGAHCMQGAAQRSADGSGARQQGQHGQQGAGGHLGVSTGGGGSGKSASVGQAASGDTCLCWGSGAGLWALTLFVDASCLCTATRLSLKRAMLQNVCYDNKVGENNPRRLWSFPRVRVATWRA